MDTRPDRHGAGGYPTAMPMPYAGNSYTTPGVLAEPRVTSAARRMPARRSRSTNGLLSTTPTSQAPALRLPGVAAGDLGGEQQRHQRRPVGRRARYGEQRQHAARLRRHQSRQRALQQQPGRRRSRSRRPAHQVRSAHRRQRQGLRRRPVRAGRLRHARQQRRAPRRAGLHPGAGSYTGTAGGHASPPRAGATIHYTLDGSPPTLASPVYTQPARGDRRGHRACDRRAGRGR